MARPCRAAPLLLLAALACLAAPSCADYFYRGRYYDPYYQPYFCASRICVLRFAVCVCFCACTRRAPRAAPRFGVLACALARERGG
jgi:hypothetical protein